MLRSPQRTMATPYAVYKYPVTMEDSFDIAMPEVCEVLDVQLQNGQPVMWALVNPDSPQTMRRFRVVGTGHPITPDERYCLSHVGSFQLGGGVLVFHLFEVVQ